MLVGGASVEYLKNFADSKLNTLIFVCYQGKGSLGRQIQEGLRELKFEDAEVEMKMEVHTLDGFS
ncbi:MAG: beta-CASP ribonuclease aCPSF1, partial [Candidatus Pacearchaeota archaeon]|nr:beta-CASP ribonuclease aCPSF1 [Candidatus Pacearchaeota archaeon]